MNYDVDHDVCTKYNIDIHCETTKVLQQSNLVASNNRFRDFLGKS